MQDKDKAKLSKLINNVLAFLKVGLCLFLGLIIIIWAAQIAEMEAVIPFYDSINNFLSNLSYVFYTPTRDSDETAGALMYMALAVVFFLMLFETITDITADILKICDKKQEEAVIEENEKINNDLQHRYKMHLKTAIRFIVTFRLSIKPQFFENQAFKDEKMETALKLKAEKMLKEITSMITMSVKTQAKEFGDMLIFNVKDAEELNQMLFFIYSICNVEKYVKEGLDFNMAVTTYNALESSQQALTDATRLMNLHSSRKILCYQIVSECLNLVPENNFNAISNGEYSGTENNIYELVKKH